MPSVEILPGIEPKTPSLRLTRRGRLGEGQTMGPQGGRYSMPSLREELYTRVADRRNYFVLLFLPSVIWCNLCFVHGVPLRVVRPSALS